MNASVRERPGEVTRSTVLAVLRVACLGAIVAAAYYAGASLGFALKLPAATPSILWPPNAILTSTLLLLPVRWWPFALFSALPAHVALEASAGWPMALVLALFGSNCSEALLAAGGLRWLSGTPIRFDSLRQVSQFLAVVVFAAPFVSSFLDATAVSIVRNEPYGQVFIARLFSNTLAALLIVPAVVMVVTSGRRWLKTATRPQRLEAAAIAIGMFFVAVFVLSDPGPDRMTAELADRAALAWFLPFILWSAIRLGPGGLSLSLLGSGLVLVSAAVHSHGPFQGLSPADTTLALQLFLIAVSAPLLVVAVLVEERRIVQQDISKRLELEALLARLSGAFVQLPSNRMHEVFTDSMRQIGESLGLECVMLFEYEDAARDMTLIAAWNGACSNDECDTLTCRAFPSAIPRLARREPVILQELGPADASPKTSLGQTIRSCVLIPLIAEERLWGVLGCGSAKAVAPGDGSVEELQLVARVLANALARRSAEDSLRASEEVKSAILSSLTYGVVVVDHEGRIIAVNERWLQMVGQDAPEAATQVGASYLEFFRDVSRSGEVWAAEAGEGLASVLARGIEFRQEYVWSRRDSPRTLAMRVVPLDRVEGGAVVTHVDLTDQRRAEGAAQQARAELAHVSRVATMGALTASIAHQLNQPLTGILANAQAARRFLAAPSPDLEEARLTLDDIMDDDRRASEVIVRMREFLRKDSGAFQEIDLNTVVRDVAHLVSSDAIIRNVSLVLQLDCSPAIVRGDRVQLQQVVLNLMVNALESLGERPFSERRLIVRSAGAAGDFIEISVIDNGIGFNGSGETAFEALHTTKPAGMGLGLSISRSIVEAHAGVIRATNNVDGGATVCFRLPRASST